MQAESGDTGASSMPVEQQPRVPQLYLAQCPLSGGLLPLREDVAPPVALADVTLSSVNLWVAARATLSSAHYDPHHNLLCVITGHKRVRLWPPSCTRYFAPHSVFGESPNHSSIRDPNRSKNAAAATACARAEGRDFTVTLQPGDALFIPAGWWHLVASGARTVGVNYWFEGSGVDDPSAVPPHMAPFAERRRVRAAAEALVEGALHRLVTWLQGQLVATRKVPGGSITDTAEVGAKRLRPRGGAACLPAKRRLFSPLSADRGVHNAAQVESASPQSKHHVPTAARLAAAKRLFCRHWGVVDTVEQPCAAAMSYPPQSPCSTNNEPSQQLCVVADDCLALALCGCADNAVHVLALLAQSHPDCMRRWLLSGMSPLATEVFTRLIEGWQVDGGLDICASSEVGACSAVWLALPAALPSDLLRNVACAGDQDIVGAAEAASDAGRMDQALAVLFADVYSLVDAGELARGLADRKEALRQSAWACKCGKGATN